MTDDMDKLVDLIVQKVKERIEPGDDAAHSVHKDPEGARRIMAAGASRLTAGLQTGQIKGDLAPIIDHTLLKPGATKEDLTTLCKEARDYGFYSVCVNAANVDFCKKQLTGTPVKVVAVVGFPLGATSMEAKAFEAKKSIEDGAEEVDMVINVGALKSRDYAYVLEDIRKVVDTVAPHPVKVIIESAMLTTYEKVIASALSKAAGAAFVKTSTGFGPGGATEEDVALIREVVGPDLGVKASGGIHTTDEARRMVKAGATRIGASASVQIVTGKKGRKVSGY
jgi:deoxyribose-phosphate aldolase